MFMGIYEELIKKAEIPKEEIDNKIQKLMKKMQILEI